MMPYFNIRWKGYPYRHLPRIRVASTQHTSVRSRSTLHAVPRDSKRPLGISAERVRKKEGLRIRRRLGRSSRSSASAVQARKRTANRAKQHIQIFGWKEPQADLASKVTTKRSGSRLSTIKPGAKTKPSTSLQNNPSSDTTVINFESTTDGAASSIVRRTKPKEREKVYSMMHVAEVPVYWTSSSPLKQKGSPVASKSVQNSPRKSHGEYAHVGPLEEVSNRNSYQRWTVERIRTYDPRINPKKSIGSRKISTPASKSADRQTTTTSRASPKKKPSDLASPIFWGAVASTALQSKDLASIVPSIKSIARNLSSDASRTPSQKKALRRFTKEIELYLQAARTLPKQSPVHSSSSTTVSANTITELKPFQSEFQSAGLAVTSAEQQGMPPLSKRPTKAPSPPPTPPKDDKYIKRRSTTVKSKPIGEEKPTKPTEYIRGQSAASGSTRTTILGFTPPHEKTYPQRAEKVTQNSSIASSEYTEVGFTPPHEAAAKSLPPPPRSPPKSPTKKSLPWLRKPEQAPEEPSPNSGPTKFSINKSKTQQVNLQDESPSSSIILHFDTPPRAMKIQESIYTPPRVSQRSTEVKWKDMNYRDEKSPSNGSLRQQNKRSGAATQTELITVDVVEAITVINYSDMATQTSSTNDTREAIPDNQEIPTSGRNKTFPVTSTKYPAYSNGSSENSVQDVQNNSPRRSHKMWKGLNQAAQTDDNNPVNNPKEVATQIERKRSSFKLKTKAVDHSQTFPLTSKITGDRMIIQVPAPPPRRAPSIPSCTQCFVELGDVPPEPESTTEYQPDVEPGQGYEIPAPRGGLSHAYTARSSRQCQQCAPPNPTFSHVSPMQSLPASPLEPPERSRRFTLPKTALEPITATLSPINFVQSPEIGNVYESLEERFMQSKYVEDAISEYVKQPPVADPMKNGSTSRLKLRSAPTSSVSPKQTQYVSLKPRSPPPNAQLLSTSPSRPQSPPGVQPSPTRYQLLSHSPPPKPLKALRSPKPTHRPVQQAVAIEKVHLLPELASTTTSVDSYLSYNLGTTDKQVFKGLHVATAAACDEDVDKWIEEITGCGVRKFLADLSKFEELGINTLAGVAKRAAKQRRDKVRAWEVLRESRLRSSEPREQVQLLVAKGNGGSNEVRERTEQFEDGRQEILNDDKNYSRVERVIDGEELLDEMAHKRDCIGKEGTRERALRMGWRERSVSDEV